MTKEEADAEKRKVLYHWIGLLDGLTKLQNAGELDIASALEQLTTPAIKSQFDETIHIIEGTDVEYWLARELMVLLGYERWENFENAIKRAMESCETSGVAVSDHFREVTKMVQLGSGSKRNVRDYMLTRYACYLIAQNGDMELLWWTHRS